MRTSHLLCGSAGARQLGIAAGGQLLGGRVKIVGRHHLLEPFAAEQLCLTSPDIGRQKQIIGIFHYC